MRSAVLLALLLAPAAGAQIFADFTTTAGSFICELNEAASPRTVANFVGLAEGSRPWLDPRTGAVRMGVPFFDGTIVHRVIGSTLLQAGTRTGAGDEGPGWVFRDEFQNGLTHDAGYVISMANSGPNSNGSQFFVTAAPLPSLNGIHTVFGKVVTGQSVVLQISKVPATNQKPVADVRIQSVAIRRVGQLARDFDVTAHHLPVVEPAPGRLEAVRNRSATYIYQGDTGGAAWFRAWRSTDMEAWSPLVDRFTGHGGNLPATWPLDPASAPRAFYYLSVTRVPDALAPADYENRKIELDFAPYDRWIYAIGADGRSGTLTVMPYPPSSALPVTMPTTLTAWTGGPFKVEWIFNTPDAPYRADVPGYIKIVGDLLDAGAVGITGKQTTYSGTEFGWAGFDAGPLKIAD